MHFYIYLLPHKKMVSKNNTKTKDSTHTFSITYKIKCPGISVGKDPGSKIIHYSLI